MRLLFALSHHAVVVLAEVAALMILIAGVWMAVAWIQQFKLQRFRMIVAGMLLAAAGLLLVIGLHWGQVG